MYRWLSFPINYVLHGVQNSTSAILASYRCSMKFLFVIDVLVACLDLVFEKRSCISKLLLCTHAGVHCRSFLKFCHVQYSLYCVSFGIHYWHPFSQFGVRWAFSNISEFYSACTARAWQILYTRLPFHLKFFIVTGIFQSNCF